MDEASFEFSAQDHGDHRLIRTVMPRAIAIQALSVDVDRYLALWETDLPIVIVHDMTRVRKLDEEVSAVFLAILVRRRLDPNFRGSACYTGNNALLAAQLRELHVQAGRDPDSVVATEAEALAYVDHCLDRAEG